MLRSIKDLRGYKIHARDDNIGKVYDFYFDDDTWTTRYLVVETGNWLSGRKVLLSPVVLGKPDWTAHIFPVALTKEQVKNSPDIDTDQPISRQQEQQLRKYYGWPLYWGGGMAPAGMYMEALAVEEMEKRKRASAEKEERGDPHLRSTREVIGYHLQASDGEIGHVEDFIVDDETWILRYMVVDTRNWLPGKKVLVAPSWIEEVSWPQSKVSVDLLRESIKDSPEFDPSEPVNRKYEELLYDYYGRPRYWDTGTKSEESV